MSKHPARSNAAHQNWDIRATAGPSVPVIARLAREPVNDDGLLLLGSLAGKVCLQETASQFPHVINRLGIFVHDSAVMLKAIDRLVVPDRPGRQGFPFAVLRELANLRERYARYLEMEQTSQDARRLA